MVEGGFSTVRLAINDETGEKFSCKIVKRDDLSDTLGSLEQFRIRAELREELYKVTAQAITY